MNEMTEAPFALHEAVQCDNAFEVERLIKLVPRQAFSRDNDGRLPIHWAVSINNIHIVRLLAGLDGFDVNIQDDVGWSPLMIAANVNDSEQVLAFLLANGADINQQNNNGQTTLHLVASKANLDVARLLFQQDPPASARVLDKRGQVPLHRAAAVGSTPMIKLLLSHGSPLDVSDISGYTALHHAVAEGHGDSAIALLKAGVDTRKRDADGLVAIALAPDPQVRQYIQRIAEQEDIPL